MLYPDPPPPPPPPPDRRIHSAGFTIIDYDDHKKNRFSYVWKCISLMIKIVVAFYIGYKFAEYRIEKI